MKFEHNGIRFEISHIDHIVINTVRRIIKPAETIMDKHGHTSVKPTRVTGKKEKIVEKGTRVWFRLKFAKGIRWGKVKFDDQIPDEMDLRMEDVKEFCSSAEIQKVIMDAMQRPDIRLWFSGTYVNIEICENWQEVQRIRAQEEKRKRKIKWTKSFTFSPATVSKMIGDAVRQSGARVVQDAIDTPFGQIPVMTISHRGE